jgi:transcriptional regulator with XRE-family HTH domain
MPPPRRSEPSNANMAALAKAIAFHKKKKGVSLLTVSKNCRLNYEHLTELARGHGNPTFDTLMTMCEGFGITIGELMTTVDKFQSKRAKSQ